MQTLYIAINGETKGPYTAEQIHSMWVAGDISADTLYFNNESQNWEGLIDIIDSLRPKKEIKTPTTISQPTVEERIKKFLTVKTPTAQEKAANEAAGNAGCGCISLGIAVVLAILGIVVMSSMSQPNTTYTNYLDAPEFVDKPKYPVHRDPYKIYSPEEERAYRQEKLNSHLRFSEEITRPKTESEKGTERTIVVVIFFMAGGMALVGWRFYSKVPKK